MRYIKFRAWDKTHSKIIKADDILNLNLRYDEIEYQEIYQYGPNPPERDICAGKLMEFVLMQSTGLKDKNGVEIYEGDILLSTASENQEDWKKWRVHYADGRFLIDYKQIPKDKRKRKNLELEDLCEDNVWIYGLEVIGNIYENPELLEK